MLSRRCVGVARRLPEDIDLRGVARLHAGGTSAQSYVPKRRGPATRRRDVCSKLCTLSEPHAGEMSGWLRQGDGGLRRFQDAVLMCGKEDCLPAGVRQATCPAPSLTDASPALPARRPALAGVCWTSCLCLNSRASCLLRVQHCVPADADVLGLGYLLTNMVLTNRSYFSIVPTAGLLLTEQSKPSARSWLDSLLD